MEPYYLDYRNDSSIDWIFKQLDHKCGLSFNSNFHFALAALLLKGEKRVYYFYFLLYCRCLLNAPEGVRSISPPIFIISFSPAFYFSIVC